jgi:pimeloyl-ACP methyl ester carboxylesterase
MLRAALAVLALSACASAPPPAPAFHPTSFTVKVTGTGRPVLFIPGLGCDGSIWDGTLAHLGGKVQAHVVSLAGFAGSRPISTPLVPTARDEIIEYVRQNHLDHPIIVGHSLGAFLAYWIAETAPDLIGGAIPVDGAPFFSAVFDPTATPEKVRPDVEQMAAGFAALPPDAFATRMSRFLGQMIVRIARWRWQQVAGVQIVRDQRGLDLEHLLEPRRRALEQLERGQVVEVRRRAGRATPSRRPRGITRS